jgi:hypothetical protein
LADETLRRVSDGVSSAIGKAVVWSKCLGFPLWEA